METRKDFVDAYGNSSLHLAIANNDYELACRLLDEGVDITLVNQAGFTPIALAAKNVSTHRFVNLIASKRNNIVEGEYVGHMEALLMMLHRDNVDAVDWLVKAGTPLTGYKVGESFIARFGLKTALLDYEPLHFAVNRNSSWLVNLLLTYGADANHGCESPLHLAKRFNLNVSVEAIDAFLKTNLTGAGIYTMLVSKPLSAKIIELYGEFKEAVFAHILTIANREDRMAALNYAKDKQTQLGSFFWMQRGFNTPTLEKGILKRIVDQLAMENKLMQAEFEKQVTLQQQLQQQQMMYSAYHTVSFFNPNAYVAPAEPVAQVVYYANPVPTVEPLMPVYSPTFTNQMNALPDVRNLPALPKSEPRLSKARLTGAYE